MVINITVDNFDSEVVNSDKPVLIDFWAAWCGPCKMLSPVIEQLGDEVDFAKICKVNIDEETKLSAAFGIHTIPTLVVMKNGKEVKRLVGVQGKNTILDALK